MYIPCENLFYQFIRVYDLPNRRYGEMPQVCEEYYGLGISIADYTDPGIPGEFRKFRFKLVPEIGIFKVMNRAVNSVTVNCGNTSAPCSEMGKIICPVKELINTA